MFLTIKLRLKDKHASKLRGRAQDVNTVWNYCNQVQQAALRWNRKWPTGYDFVNLTSGSYQYFSVSANTIQQVCFQYEASRRSRNKPFLRWRGKKSLGWIPLLGREIRFDGKNFYHQRQPYTPMHLHPALKAGMKFKQSSFNEDARGRWYLNLVIEVQEAEQDFTGAVGIDLGLKSLATTSEGEVVEAPQFYRGNEAALVKNQRARKSKRVRKVHARTRNQRKDFLHKLSHRLTSEKGTIIAGNVSPSKLAKTRLAKSVNDASWADFKNMLSYKSIRNGGRYLEVNEAYSSQTCSTCHARSGPKGLKGLSIREWSCSECGTVHNRDTNAAKNILRIGLDTLAEGAPVHSDVGSSQTCSCRYQTYKED